MSVREPGEEVSPDAQFGLGQAKFAFDMARGITPGIEDNRSMQDRVIDAVRTATRLFERDDVNIEGASKALLGLLMEGVPQENTEVQSKKTPRKWLIPVDGVVVRTSNPLDYIIVTEFSGDKDK